MKQKLKYGVGIFFCGAMALAGFSAAVMTGKVINLILSIIFLLLMAMLIRKWPGRKAKVMRKKKVRQAASRSTTVQTVRPVLKDSVSVKVHSSSEEIDENIRAKNAPISYLDARALQFWDQKPTDYQIPSYYAGSAFGRNVEPARDRLLGSDPQYLKIGGIEKSIELKKVPELRELLATRGLKVSGKKAELIQRLVDGVPKSELESMFPVRVYEITDSGKKALKYYSIIFANENHNLGLSFYRLLKVKEENPNLADEEILLQVLMEDIHKDEMAGGEDGYRIHAEKTAHYLEEIGRPDTAIGCYCVAFFMFWYRNAVMFGVDECAEAYSYQAKTIDRCGKLCGYGLDDVLKEFRSTIQEINPFSLGTNQNIDRAIHVFRKALSV